MATSAPDGSAWARQARAFGREVEEATYGELRIKWYFSGIAGDEPTALERVRRHQLDGVAAAAVCGTLAPTLGATQMVGLFRSRDESSYVLGRLRGTLDQEFRESGFANLGVAGFGIDIIFTRQPVRSFADLKRGAYFVWDLDQVVVVQLRAMGVQVLAAPLTEAARSFDEGKIDGFVASPSAALVFQWSGRAGYFSDLHIGFQPACLLIANAAIDQLPLEQQKTLRVAGNRLVALFDSFGRAQDQQLLGQLFEHQGVKRVAVDANLRGEFFESARSARAALDERIVQPAPVRRIMDLLADYRAEQGATP
jgi:TRAP-type C4-dicarboxylate transport system substrate-binding protein